VFVTQNRRKKLKTLTPELLEYLRQAFGDCLTAWRCKLIEFRGKKDHVHLLLGTPPCTRYLGAVSALMNKLKTSSACSAYWARARFTDHLGKFDWKPLFWHWAYFGASERARR
jgi:putative transposase